MPDNFSIAFVSGKLGDVDGVSLEVDKWIDILRGFGHRLYAVSGKYVSRLPGIHTENQFLLPEIRFDSNEQRDYERQVFPHLSKRPPHLNTERQTRIVEDIVAKGNEIANLLLEIVQDNDIDVLIAENTNAMPMTLLGGMGIYRLATESRVATIFHHHDFWWERSRFSRNYIENLLNQIMPPIDLGFEHVVISSYAAHILSSLKRVSPFIIPNCEDFTRPVVLDEYNGNFRADFGFDDDDILVVQPTRVVPRKRIEDSVELLVRFKEKYPKMGEKIRSIISLYQGDEPDETYIDRIRNLASKKGLSFHMISDHVASVRSMDSEGRRIYTNRDVLANANLVTYLPVWEGFGNALLEAIAARVPIVVSTYLVYKTDIKITGLSMIEVRDRYGEEGKLCIPDSVLDEMHYMCTHTEQRKELVEQNYQIAKREFGMETLRTKLARLFELYGDEIRASRKRVGKSKTRYSV